MKISAIPAAIAACAALSCGSMAHAAVFNQALASNAYISFGGYEWAWASPLSNNVDLSYQSQFGWRLPTAAELLAAPSATDFLFAGGNAVGGTPDPISGSFWAFTSSSNFASVGAGACAAAYFNALSNCDYGNAPGSAGLNVVAWAGQPGAVGISESLVIRDSAAVPEPSTLALIGLALGSLGLTRRSRRNRRSA